MDKSKKVVFMGTPDFAVPSLKRIIEEFEVIAVFTQPDRPKGRGKKLAISPIKEVALEHGIKLYQPEKLKNEPDVIQELKDMNPDFIIVVAFGQILTKEVIDIPKYGCINLHASLLPKYRGAAPINWAIIDGESKSGNTTMLIDVGLDTGDMLLKDEVDITENMTAGELHDILTIDGAELLIKTLYDVIDNKIIPQKQNDKESCYASMLNKKMANIDWNKSAKDIHNLIRGLNPWPVAYTHYETKTMKIYESKVLNENSKGTPGKIVSVDTEGIKVEAKDNILLITKIQFPGGKPMEVKEYIKGHSINIGEILK